MKKKRGKTYTRSAGRYISELRKATQVSQSELAAKLDVTRSRLSKIESGELLLRIDELTPICDFFSIGADDFLSREVDSWDLAVRFGARPPVHARYRLYPYIRGRFYRPLLNLVAQLKRISPVALCAQISNGTKSDFLLSPNQRIGTLLELDLFNMLDDAQLATIPQLKDMMLKSFEDDSYDRRFQKEVNRIVCTAGASEAWQLFASYFDENFSYRFRRLQGKKVISILPKQHLREDVFLKAKTRANLVQYRKSFISVFHSFYSSQKVDQVSYHVSRSFE